MSKLLADLLGSDRRELQAVISRLEHMTLSASTDVRLTAEIITQTREKVRRLGLDPIDSTAEEFYYALRSKAKSDDISLRDKLKISDQTKPVDAAKIIAQATEKLLKKDLVICMQPPAVKKILKSVPPKKTMKALRFRSIDSVLKREDPLVLYALAKRLESESWNSQLQARLKRLHARDVAECPVQVLSLPEEWLEKLKNHEFSSVVQPVAETGSVLLLPSMPLKVPGSVLLTTALVLQAAQKLAIESLPYRTRALGAGMESLLPDIAAGLLYELGSVHGLKPSWSAVYQLLSEQSKHRLPDFEFVLNDLYWESTETRIASISSELDFWVNTHYLGYSLYPNLPISLHIVDVAASLVLNRDFGSQIISHLRKSLWNELQVRYLKHDVLEKSIVSQLTVAQGIVL